VRVYQWSASSWTQLGADIDAEAAGDGILPVALSSDGTILAVGAMFNSGAGSVAGHVRVYQWSASSWTQLGADIDGNAYDYFGHAVALNADGTILVISGNIVPPLANDAGFVRIYQWSNGAWTQLLSDIVGKAPGDESGYGLAISADGDMVAIGSPKAWPTHVRVFELVGLIQGKRWQPSSTWKTADTYYLRYKATDAAGNDTPNDASHYLTVTVSS